MTLYYELADYATSHYSDHDTLADAKAAALTLWGVALTTWATNGSDYWRTSDRADCQIVEAVDGVPSVETD